MFEKRLSVMDMYEDDINVKAITVIHGLHIAEGKQMTRILAV